ncbi:MAG: GtrA family protein [bacterium]|nr:GtrA family protein [bacterium]
MKNKVINFWFSLSDKIRFLFVGGFNFAFAYFLFIVMTLIIGKEHYQLDLVLSWLLSSFVSYTTQKTLVFCTKGNIIKEYFKCFTSWMVSYAVNALLLELFVGVLSINVFVSQFFATGMAAVVTYILFKFFAFKQK